MPASPRIPLSSYRIAAKAIGSIGDGPAWRLESPVGPALHLEVDLRLKTVHLMIEEWSLASPAGIDQETCLFSNGRKDILVLPLPDLDAVGTDGPLILGSIDRIIGKSRVTTAKGSVARLMERVSALSVILCARLELITDPADGEQALLVPSTTIGNHITDWHDPYGGRPAFEDQLLRAVATARTELKPNEHASAHERMAATDVIAAFYEEAGPDLGIDAAEARRIIDEAMA